MSEKAPRGLGRGRVVSSRAQTFMQVRTPKLGSRRSSGPKSRVVVKANFIRMGKSGAGRDKAFAAANYMLFRPSEDGEARKGFDGQKLLDPHEVHQRIGEQSKQHQYAYRMVMSPDRNFGEQSTREWAANTLKKAGYENFIVVSHAGEKGHTKHPHAHVMVFTDARLERTDFQRLRDYGDIQAKEIQMRLTHDKHMGGMDWKTQKEDEFKQWKAERETKQQIKSDGVEDLSAAQQRGQKDRQHKKQMDLEM